MDFILILVGMAIAVWAISMLFSPPKKHKDFTLHDQDQATIWALGGSGTPDMSTLKAYKPRKSARSIIHDTVFDPVGRQWGRCFYVCFTCLGVARKGIGNFKKRAR